DGVKSLNDFSKLGHKPKFALQQGGPHIGFLDLILNSLHLHRQDIDIVWTDDLIGAKGPDDAMRNDKSIDAAFVITPAMQGLTGGLDKVGNGKEGTINGAHVVVSTQSMSRAIPDVLAVASYWYNHPANKQTADKIIAGYLKECTKLVAMRKQFESTKRMTPE